MKEKNKKVIFSIVAVLLLVLLTIGVTYAVFTSIQTGSTENTVTAGTLKFLYTENTGIGAGIMLTDALPVSDAVGKSYSTEGKVFDFSVEATNTGTEIIPYEVTLRKKSDSTLPEDAVKIYLTDMIEEADSELLEPTLYSNLTQTDIDVGEEREKTIYTDSVPGITDSYLKDFRLRMWVDENIDFSNDLYTGKTFTAIVNVYSNVPLVSEEEIALRNNADILGIEANNSKAITVDNSDYNYEIGLATGTTSTTIDVETVAQDTDVEIEKVTSLENLSSNITYEARRIVSSNQVTLTEGDNYFKITTTAPKGATKSSILNIHVGEYTEVLLNEADPILKDKLVPVIIDNKGTVQKVDINYKWYDYETKKWGNAVILKDESITYTNGDIIPEENIESYFVWIPKYSYQIFDLGNYSSLTSTASKEQVINIKFGLTNTSDNVSGECTIPGIAGESGNCEVGDYMTHPAFLSFDSTGFWVGKFETGYDGATSTTEAQVNSVDTSKIVVKPNVYSWRNITVGNIFKNGYDYNRNLDSHAMKNTEWGAVAYLQHSVYGSATSVRVNNNSSFITGYASTEEPILGHSNTSVEGNRFESTTLGIDGTYTINYLNPSSTVSSTTNNYTGVYDMSGGSYEYVMGYTTGTTTVGGVSGITDLYSNFFSDNTYTKYWDKYTSTSYTQYNSRILGDATGEMGPFWHLTGNPSGINSAVSSWYTDFASFINSDRPWFIRSCNYNYGKSQGIFAFNTMDGSIAGLAGFRIVLTPTE